MDPKRLKTSDTPRFHFNCVPDLWKELEIKYGKGSSENCVEKRNPDSTIDKLEYITVNNGYLIVINKYIELPSTAGEDRIPYGTIVIFSSLSSGWLTTHSVTPYNMEFSDRKIQSIVDGDIRMYPLVKLDVPTLNKTYTIPRDLDYSLDGLTEMLLDDTHELFLDAPKDVQEATSV